MAKIKLGAVIADIRGKVGGTVALSGRGGAVLRTSVYPARKSSPLNDIGVSIFGTLNANWRKLTAAQQAAWIAAAQNAFVRDVYGVTHKKSGSSLYVSANFWLSRNGNTLLTLPVVPVSIPQVTVLTLTFSQTGASFNIANTASGTATNWLLITTLSLPRSAGTFAATSKMSYFSRTPLNTNSGGQYNSYVGQFTAPKVGQRIFYKGSILNTVTGQYIFVASGYIIVT